MLWFCQSVALAISARVAPSLRFINSRTFSALLPDRVLFGLVAFATFFAFAGFVAFVDFLLAFAFLGFAVSVAVVSCSLIVVLLCVECIGRHIHHSSSEGMRGERARKWTYSERTGCVGGKRGNRPCGRHQSNTDSNGSLMFSVQFSGMPVLRPGESGGRHVTAGGCGAKQAVDDPGCSSIGWCSSSDNP